jgi:hypothetical protein
MTDRASHLEVVETGSAVRPKMKANFQNLRLYSATYTEESFLKLFYGPIVLLLLPPVLWAALMESVTIGFFVAIISNVAITFATVYHFQSWQTGLCFFSCIIRSLLAIAFAGLLLDTVADFFTRRNGGIREPEMRIPAIVLSTVLVPVGLILCDVGIDNELYWIVPTIGVGLCMSTTSHLAQMLTTRQ